MKINVEKAIQPKWWNPVYWVLGLLTLCVSVTLGLCWAGVAFVSGCI